MSKLVLLLVVSLVHIQGCYWNGHCPYDLFGSKTPYDTVRGDIRDYATLENCEAASIWTLNRHGNRNPGTSVTARMQALLTIKDEIIDSYRQNKSELCAQDIENFQKWVWNSTLEESQSFLTGIGYEELFDMGKRIRHKYGNILEGTADQFYFRPTNEQRTVTSCMAFVHGLTDGVDLAVTVEDPWKRDDVIRAYQNCDRYQQEVRQGATLANQMETYFLSPEFVIVQNAVQKRLGITTQLTSDNIFTMFEICRFHRSWTNNLQDSWCAVFTDEDLITLEYYDDVRHYYRNGYGSQVNVDLGKAPLKDLYENFEAVVNGQGRKVVSYFTHDTMMEMVWSAMGLYKDDVPIDSLHRNPDRLWRSSFIGAFSTNLIAVLNRCNESGSDSYRVQLFINEEVTPLCSANGCTWEEFRAKFQIFTTSNLDFCSMDYEYPATNKPASNSAMSNKGLLKWF